MKTEFLKELGLSDEQISSIMKENGKDISKEQAKAEKTNQELENIQSKLDEKEQLLNDANSQIEKFKGMDVESKDKAIQEWQEKYKLKEDEFKTKELEYQQKLEQQQYDFKLNEFVNGQKFTSEFAKKAYIAELKAQGFKLGEDGTLIGASEYTEKFKAANQGVFLVEETPKDPLPEIVKGTDPTAPKTKMSLMEMMKLKNENPNAQLPI